jgi:serine/threonine protein kinase
VSDAVIPLPLTRPVPQPLRRFGKYHLVQKLAEGGMAEIFLAKQLGAQGFERDVVVKCMLEHFSSSGEFVEMFLDEARVAARLFHPNIVQITDLGVADGRYFICMEYLPGEDLQRIIDRCSQRGTPIPISIAAKIIQAACEGLEFAHSYQEGGRPAQLVHRDVSPSNIIVTYQGHVKVLDFGIAKASSKLVQTQPGTVKGKLGYMSPEQARGEPLDARCDVFSLGITLHELLTGRRVFEKDSEVSVLMAMISQPIPPPSSIRADVPPAIDAVVMRAVEKDRRRRYPSAAAMREDLDRFLTGSVSAPGISQLSAFMLGLFGPEQAARRMQIPTLKELASKGYVIPPDDRADPATGFERTMVRSLEDVTPIGHPIDASMRETTIQARTIPVAHPLPRRRSVVWIAIAAGLLAVAGGAVVLQQLGVLDLGFLARRATRVEVKTSPAEAVAPTASPTGDAPVAATQGSGKSAQETSPPPRKEKTEEAATSATSPSQRMVVLGMKDVYSAMSKRKAGIVGCGESHRGDLPPDGRVVVRMEIERSGAVGVQIVSPGIETTRLGACLAEQIRSLRFPKNRNDPPLKIELPLRFNER